MQTNTQTVSELFHTAHYRLKWHTEFGHLNRGDMLTSEQDWCPNEKKKF
ncbi:IS4 orf [Escherichia coli TA008]|nr:transposase [Escherichia coli]OSL65557.1 IS4 orf [Escherichia coli TA008]